MWGHEVPISKIVSCYYKSILNIGKAITLVDRVYVYDNSVENKMLTEFMTMCERARIVFLRIGYWENIANRLKYCGKDTNIGSI